jgi:thiol-disulfide isomerase/thioredoxin
VRRAVVASLAVLGIALSATAVEVDLEYVDDITALTSECFVRALRLDAILLEGTEDAPQRVLDGRIPLADREHAVRIELGDDEPRLFVDVDGSGQLVRSQWDRRLVDGSYLANVPLTLTYEDGGEAPYRIFLVWYPFLPTALTFCRDTYREGEVTLGDRTMRIGIVDADTDGRYDILEGGVLLLDTDGDGELLATGDSHEMFFLDDLFNVGGVTYAVVSVSANGEVAQIETSAQSVPPKAPLFAGYPAPTFSGSSPSGDAVSLESYLGDVVVLDFWAGWCGPCVGMIPTLKTLRAEYGERGLTLLGVNLDKTAEDFEQAVGEHGIDWPQVFDGPAGPIGDLYRIEGIPMTYLIDAEGTIVARGLRGQELIDAVSALLDEPKGADE